MNSLMSLIRSMVRPFINRTRFSYRRDQTGFSGLVGVEIGGPGVIFRNSGLFPVYWSARRLDKLDFSRSTFWSKYDIPPELRPGENLGPGISRFRDTNQLEMLEANCYNFLLAPHIIKYLANPIKSLLNWERPIRSDGLMVVIAPERRSDYDCNRSVTPLSHLDSDFLNEMPETDLTHFSEVIEKHDIEQDSTVKTIAELYARTQNNAANRIMHHHVLDVRRLSEIGARCGIKLISGGRILLRHFLCVFRKVHE